MRVRFKIVAALVICLLGAAGEAGSQGGEFNITPLENPFLLPLPDPRLGALEQTIQEQGARLRRLEERAVVSDRYLTGGFIATSALLLLILSGVGLLAVYLRRQTRDAMKVLRGLEVQVASAASRAEEVDRRFDGMKPPEISPQFEEQLGRLTEKINEVEGKISAPPAVPPELDRLARDFAAMKEALGNGSSKASSPSVSLLPLEREVLKEAWIRFMENKEIMAALANARDERLKQVEEPLLLQLPRCVPQDLKPSLDAALAPVKDFNNLMTRIYLVPRLLGEDNKSSAKPESKELLLLRELTSLLAMIQTSNLLADRLNFRLEPWIADSFLGFADLFLQRYQTAQMEKREKQFQPGHEIVRQILKIADLEPVDLTLGVTPFDSARHIGRSTASDPNVASGVILGVIRNGFVRGGQQVIRQPEVIVNRVA